MIDFIIGTLIGLLAAGLIVWRFIAGGGYGDIWHLLGGFASGTVGGLGIAFVVFLVLLGQAFRPH